MRLTPDQIQIIQSVVHEFAGKDAKAWLFGSRLDKNRRGGDVDLLVQCSPEIGILQRARIKNRLETRLGLPVDVLSAAQDGAIAPFARIALAQGARLCPSHPRCTKYWRPKKPIWPTCWKPSSAACTF
jgi:predicted nucleotidyltransferase